MQYGAGSVSTTLNSTGCIACHKRYQKRKANA
jgi:hypothetical protein